MQIFGSTLGNFNLKLSITLYFLVTPWASLFHVIFHNSVCVIVHRELCTTALKIAGWSGERKVFLTDMMSLGQLAPAASNLIPCCWVGLLSDVPAVPERVQLLCPVSLTADSLL